MDTNWHIVAGGIGCGPPGRGRGGQGRNRLSQVAEMAIGVPGIHSVDVILG